MKRLLSIALSLILSNNLLIASSISDQEKINKSINTLNTMATITIEAKKIIKHHKDILHNLEQNTEKDPIYDKIMGIIKKIDRANALYEDLHSRIVAHPNSNLARAYQTLLNQKQYGEDNKSDAIFEETDRAICNEIDIDSYQLDELIPDTIEILDEIISSKSSPSNQSHTLSASIGKRSFAEMDETTKYPPTNTIDRTSLRRTPKEITRYYNEDEESRRPKRKKQLKKKLPIKTSA